MSETIVQATHGSADHPLRIGEMEIPCYVLEDGRRVLVQERMLDSLSVSPGGHADTARKARLAKFAAEKGVTLDEFHGGRLGRFIAGEAIQPYVPSELLHAIANPIKFKTPSGLTQLGYEANILADVCEAVLKARETGRLTKQQENIAKRCEILVRGFARVGIIALVDEATGYQEYRARQALEEILRKFVSEELRKWAKTFPDEFYRELFRLKGLTYSQVSTKRPAYLGHITNDIIYERLAPGVLEELQRLTPKLDSGRRKYKLFQHLTDDIGHPKLREHLVSVIALMRASPNWTTFYRLLQRSLPKFGEQLPLMIDDDIETGA